MIGCIGTVPLAAQEGVNWKSRVVSPVQVRHQGVS